MLHERFKSASLPWNKVMWCIPPEHNAEFVCQMEQVLEVYKRPYDPAFPVVCIDEQPKQLFRERRLSARPGKPERIGYEYVREGTWHLWKFVEPLGGWRDVRVSDRKTALDWASQIKALVDDPRFARAEAHHPGLRQPEYPRMPSKDSRKHGSPTATPGRRGSSGTSPPKTPGPSSNRSTRR
jgi:hypothetical protein